MKKIYIAGKYRADTVSGIRRNIEEARNVAEMLWVLGFAVFCPHLNSALMDGIAPDRNFLEGDIEWLKCADAIVMLPGWRYSKGSVAEFNFAKAAGIPTFEWIKFTESLCIGDTKLIEKEELHKYLEKREAKNEG